MSTPDSTAPPPDGATLEANSKKVDYLIVYGHSNLFYWWPVWLVSFVLAAVTYIEGNQMAVVPAGTVVERDRTVEDVAGRRDVLVAPAGKSFSLARETGQARTPGMTVSSNNNLGVIFVATIFFVALASTILLRGLVSIIVLVAMIAIVVVFALLGWWDEILLFLGGLDIRMNAVGYLGVGIPVFLAWLFVIFLYDRATYIVFDQGQLRYVHEVGDAEIAIQADGAIVEKKRNDVFRHWLLGFGTGDLKIKIGHNGMQLDLENVLFINSKLALIQRLVKEKSITIEA